MTRPIQYRMTLPREHEVKVATHGKRELMAHMATKVETQPIQILDDKKKAHQVEVPTSALRLLVEILGELADGNAVKIVPVHAELSTQQAADLLNVSRPHLIKLLEAGTLPFYRTGRHRRIKFNDVMEFKANRDSASVEAMSELARLSQELDMGYN